MFYCPASLCVPRLLSFGSAFCFVSAFLLSNFAWLFFIIGYCSVPLHVWTAFPCFDFSFVFRYGLMLQLFTSTRPLPACSACHLIKTSILPSSGLRFGSSVPAPDNLRKCYVLMYTNLCKPKAQSQHKVKKVRRFSQNNWENIF